MHEKSKLTGIVPETEPPPMSFSNRFLHLTFFWRRCFTVTKSEKGTKKQHILSMFLFIFIDVRILNLPAMESADPTQSDNVAKRFINAAVFCMSCCLSSHNIIFKASAKTSPWSLFHKNKTYKLKISWTLMINDKL